ncbi:unnamed protein product [Thlaspi arvense]|uniref:Uncharacterized protein n=1 Tax=Thlaspi arvense TaxID=13288 RepID=A0AAU9T494_THLAR|nr:unnamed protein product [Thlaspi arvense]
MALPIFLPIRITAVFLRARLADFAENPPPLAAASSDRHLAVMDSMNADLKQVSETTLPTSCSCCSFDIEVLCASMVSSDIDGAEAYLSDFTKIDSNYESNLMFYLLKRQRVMKLLLE